MSDTRTPKIRPDDAPTSGLRAWHLRHDDRPPIVGSVGRSTGEVRLRVAKHTDKETLVPHVHCYTSSEATIHTDEWRAYERIVRKHFTVSLTA